MSDLNLNINRLQGEDSSKNVIWFRLNQFSSDKITVHFEGIEDALVHYILESTLCFGCVAWLTNEKILAALSKCESVSIIVQKEDFLRPDYPNMQSNWKRNQDSWKQKLKRMYDSLPDGVTYEMLDIIYLSIEHQSSKDLDEAYELIQELFDQTNINPREISHGTNWETKAIRTLGEINENKLPAFPRMHHKFLIFFDEKWEPYAVWTGSFNFTYNATRSLENGLYITDKVIVYSYWLEWIINLINSEPLDWSSEYIDLLRIGT